MGSEDVGHDGSAHTHCVAVMFKNHTVENRRLLMSLLFLPQFAIVPALQMGNRMLYADG
jgi:hypothetical protein